jgi:putative ABC transport system substrate-binding protein
MKRRDFIALLGGTAIAWPRAACAQQPAMPVIGFLGSTAAAEYEYLAKAFREGLSETGYADGQNVSIHYGWADDHPDRLRPLADEFVRLNVAVIFASGGYPSALAAKGATSTIPIVFANGSDPVRSGLVASINRPGGNVTGVSFLATTIITKRLELLSELVPHAAAFGVFFNPNNPDAEVMMNELKAAERTKQLRMIFLVTTSERDFAPAFAQLLEQKADALLIGNDVVFNAGRARLAELATKNAVPAIFETREFVAEGGLMGYGASFSDAYRQAGIYVGRILKGAKPADLPVLQPTKFELVINLKTAKALGLTVPPTLLALADEVIE